MNEKQKRQPGILVLDPVSLLSITNSVQLGGGGRGISTRNLNPAPVEVYNEENNSWSVEEQGHFPPNNLGAVNKFPIDSGIRKPPGEAYNVSLNEWENMAEVMSDAVLCYLPVKEKTREQSKVKVHCCI